MKTWVIQAEAFQKNHFRFLKGPRKNLHDANRMLFILFLERWHSLSFLPLVTFNSASGKRSLEPDKNLNVLTGRSARRGAQSPQARPNMASEINTPCYYVCVCLKWQGSICQEHRLLYLDSCNTVVGLDVHCWDEWAKAQVSTARAVQKETCTSDGCLPKLDLLHIKHGQPTPIPQNPSVPLSQNFSQRHSTSNHDG